MASIKEELHSSLRREARKLLEEAATMAEVSKRRAHLVRAFSLVQQAETYRNLLQDNVAVFTAPLAPMEQVAHQVGQPGRRAPALAKRSG
jgi:hypothetical protein